MNNCANQESTRVDAERNHVYNALLSKTSHWPEVVAKIKAQERAWIAYRDAYIEAMYPAKDKQGEYGSMFPMEAYLLRVKLTKEHITALKELLKQGYR